MAGRISALQYRPNYGGDSVLGDFFGAQNAAMDSVDRFTRQRASKRAGQAMARGDYQAGANEFYDAGHLDAGSEVQNYGQAQEDRSATQAATARAQQQDQIKQRAELLSQVASGLKTVPMGQRKAQLDAISPVFTKVGLDTEMFGQLTEDDLTDAALDTFTGAVAKEVEQYTLSPGSKRYDAKGNLIAEAPFAPFAPEVVKYQDGAGETVAVVDRNGGAAPAGAPSGQSIAAAVQSLVPGVTVTSGRRTPERNAAVGGAANSYHLSGQAMDLTPPPGMNMAQLEQRLRASGLQFAELINEGDHIHVAWSGDGAPPSGAGGTRVVARGAAKPEDTTAGQARAFTQENQLRNQFGNQPAVKDLASVQAHVRTIGAIANKAKTGQPVTAADDLALIFAYMKMLDPGSVVREGEFANAQNTAGIPDRIRNAYNKAINGTRLSDKQRSEFFNTATTVMDSYTHSYADQAERSRGLANSYGLDADRVAPAPARPRPRGAPTPARTQVATNNPALDAARQAIKAGAPRAAVIERLRQNGIDPRGL